MSQICYNCDKPLNYTYDFEEDKDEEDKNYCEDCIDVEDFLEDLEEERIIDVDKAITRFNNRLIDARIQKIKLNYKMDKLRLTLAILKKHQMKQGLLKAFEEFEKTKQE